MSVHGEYERALENVILRLGQLPAESSAVWVDAFSALRMKHQPELSTAARECLSLIDRVVAEIPALAMELNHADRSDRTDPVPLGNILADSSSHLRAHCRAILGVTALNDR